MPFQQTHYLQDGETITIAIEVDSLPDGEHVYEDLRAGQNILGLTRAMLDDGLTLARNCASRVVENLKMMDGITKPDEFELQFAVKLDTEVGAVIAKAQTGAQLQIKMTWKTKGSQ